MEWWNWRRRGARRARRLACAAAVMGVFWASGNGTPAIAQTLQPAPPAASAGVATSYSPVVEALKHHDLAAAQRLVEQGAPLPPHGAALVVAVQQGDDVTVRWLLDRGDRLDPPTWWEMLILSRDRGQASIHVQLRQAGRRWRHEPTPATAEQGDHLIRAAADGDAATVQSLLQAGLPDDPQAVGTAYYLAGLQGQWEIVHLLDEPGRAAYARLNWIAARHDALDLAIRHDNIPLIRGLIEQGAALDNGWRPRAHDPWDLVRQFRRPDVARLLLELGVQPDVDDVTSLRAWAGDINDADLAARLHAMGDTP